MNRIILALVVFALATPASAEMEGPFSVVDKTNCTTTTDTQGNAVTTCAAIPGLHYIVSAAFYAAHADVLAPYKDASQTNLQNVYAGDSPANPTQTVALTFPDSATVISVETTLGLISATP